MLEDSSHFRALLTAGSVAAALLLAPAPGLALDDFEVTRLQQEFQQLQQKTLQLEMRIESLERQLAEARAGVPAGGSRPAPTAGNAPMGGTTGASAAPRTAPQPPWLNLPVWDRVQPGMLESEVLQLLGVPNSLRRSEDGKSLLMLYALELGSGGFLGGSVRLADRRVVEILKPTLK